MGKSSVSTQRNKSQLSNWIFLLLLFYGRHLENWWQTLSFAEFAIFYFIFFSLVLLATLNALAKTTQHMSVAAYLSDPQLNI